MCIIIIYLFIYLYLIRLLGLYIRLFHTRSVASSQWNSTYNPNDNQLSDSNNLRDESSLNAHFTFINLSNNLTSE